LHDRGTAGPDEHHVLAEAVELLAVAGAEAFPQADQQEQGTDSPGDSEHGQKRAQLVRPQGTKGLAEDVEDQAH